MRRKIVKSVLESDAAGSGSVDREVRFCIVVRADSNYDYGILRILDEQTHLLRLRRTVDLTLRHTHKERHPLSKATNGLLS